MRFLIFYFSVVFCISPLIHFSKTIHVGKNALNKSIQVALAQSQPYDTILVSPGVYHEKNLIIGKPLVLIGSNYPVLDGENKYEI
ncbi:MAG TPA: nitrous oxide reductase family maturation protein NosD, partial [Bacteroidia bacterium]|nr:nitrous oxide reductase family maturation protein NosD [Bacteroidia bacterium]